MWRSNSAPILVLIFFGSIGVTLLLWGVIPGRYFDSSSWDYDYAYRPLSDTILAGHAFIWTGPGPAIQVPENAPILKVRPGSALVRFPPGYSIIIAATRDIAGRLRIPESYGIDALNLVAVGICAASLFAIASSVFGGWFALAVPGLWVTYPGLLFITRQPASEIPFCAFVFAALAVVWPSIDTTSVGAVRWITAGVLLGCAMLVRAEGIGLSLATGVIFVVFARRAPLGIRLFRMAMVVLGSVVAVLPWEMWAYHHTSAVIPIATSGPQSFCDGLTFAFDRDTRREKIELSAGLKELSLEFLDGCYKASASTEAVAFLFTQARRYPEQVFGLMMLKAARSWYATNSGRADRKILAIQLGYGVMFILATAVSMWRPGTPRVLASIVWALVIYFWAMTIAVLSILRYMVPAIGLLFLLVPAAFKTLRPRSAAR
jgi:hypothetical protein